MSERVTSLSIWINHHMTPAELDRLREGTRAHHLVLAPGATTAAELRTADLAFGQPPIPDLLESPRLRWVQLSSAGYGSYDRADLRRCFAERGTALTKSSYVYAAPCAEHVLSLMLAWARRLPDSVKTQASDRRWPTAEIRRSSVLLQGQRVILFGFGSIGARLIQLLRPFTPHITGVRRQPRGDEGALVVSFDDARLPQLLAEADHVVNLLPGVDATRRYFDAQRFAGCKQGAIFYNVGRGATVDQEALLAALETGQLGAALLDVTDPEPLPPEHPLWRAPRCVITPHSAGGHHDEGYRLVDHFLDNLRRFERGEPVLDRAF